MKKASSKAKLIEKRIKTLNAEREKIAEQVLKLENKLIDFGFYYHYGDEKIKKI